MTKEPETTRWTCPGCQRRFRLRIDQTPPNLCRDCRQVESKIAAASQPSLENLAAAVRADHLEQKNKGLEAPALPVFQELREVISDQPPQLLVPPRSVFIPAPVGLFRRRGIQISAALIAFVATPLWFFMRERPPNGAAAHLAMQPIVAAFMKAPKTAEFSPDPHIKPQGEGWTIYSYIDAKNPMGVPLRSEWHSLVYFDRTAGKYAPDYIYLGDELVFESENRRELREAMQKIANNLAADRREQGTWKELVSFEGSGNEKTESFKTHWTGFRLRFKYFYEFSVRVYEGSRLIKTVTINRDHQAPEFVDVPAGEYTLRIQSDNPRRYPWRVFVEE